MPLAAKIFLATSLVLLVLVVVAGWSLEAIKRVLEVNRAIIHTKELDMQQERR